MNQRLRTRRRRLQRQRARRGVLLLVVLSMLVLFLLIGATFLVVSNQYRTASKVVEKANRTTFQPADLLERALMQLVRDTNNPTSVVRYHSLLRDMYGADGFVGRAVAGFTQNFGAYNPLGITNADDLSPRFVGGNTTTPLGVSNGQIVEFYVHDDEEESLLDPDFSNITGLGFDENGVPLAHKLSASDGYYEGCLLTFTSGPCRGSTVRILEYRLASNNANLLDTPATTIDAPLGRFRITAPRRADGQPLSIDATTAILTDLVDPAASNPSRGVRFIVNGRPFNGAGVGLNPLALSYDLQNEIPVARLSALEAMRNPTTDTPYTYAQIALTPNSVYFDAVREYLAPPAPPATPATLEGSRTNIFTDLGGNNFDFLSPGFLDNDASTTAIDPFYSNFAGPGDTDESYDAPDYQNMALASQALEPRLRGRVVNASNASIDPDAYYTGTTDAPQQLDLDGVTIPSFHRPALTNYWFHRIYNSTWLSGVAAADRVRAILEPYDSSGTPHAALGTGASAETLAAQIAAIKRKFMMRPLREDHPDFDGSNPLSRYSTDALRNALDGAALVNNSEITFPYWEAVGPWDVDNDGDSVPDSVWVDIGLPVQQTEDGRWYKPLVAVLVEDLDGRLNVNAHGSVAELIGEPLDFSTDGTDPVGNLAQDYNNGAQLFSSDQLPEGAGWGTADISLRSIFSPTLPIDEYLGGGGPTGVDNPLDVGFTGNPQYDDYARLLYGRPDPSDSSFRGTAATALRVKEAFGRYGVGAATSYDLVGPGVTFLPLADSTSDFDTRYRDQRTPIETLGAPQFTNAVTESPSGYTTPADLGMRYAGAGLIATGSEVAEPIHEANFNGITWREQSLNAADDSPYEIDLSVPARRLPPVTVAAITASYDGLAPLVDDSPFAPADLEKVLRALDSDAETLPDRLWRTVDAVDPAKYAAATALNATIRANVFADDATFVPNSLQNVVATAQTAINRRQITTDSWDLPVPHENWTDRLILGADGVPGVPYFDTNRDGIRSPGDQGNDDGDLGIGIPNFDDDGDTEIDEVDEWPSFDEGDEAIAHYNASGSHTFADGSSLDYDTIYNPELDAPTDTDLEPPVCDDYVVIMRDDPPAQARIIDYLRYRVVLELKKQGLVRREVAHTDPTLAAEVNRILFGDDVLESTDGLRNSNRYSFGGLLAPEVLAGLRMDLNRPFGDGRDNNGDGVVDDPAEAGEPYTFDSTFPSGELQVVDFQDLDGDNLHYQDLDDDGVLYVDNDLDGTPDRFDSDDLADRDRNADGVLDGVLEPIVDNLWVDDNGDGVRDATEFRPFDYTRGADANGRGGIVDTSTGVRDDARLARQLYARHLYCLMLALVDDGYLAPYDANDPQVLHYIDPLSGDTSGSPLATDTSVAFNIAAELYTIGDHTVQAANAADEVTRQNALAEARRQALRKLTCRRLAQWAINVVDYRDPDAIQTPFEYDENPWDGWNVVDSATGNVYPIDGDLSTEEHLTQFREISGAGAFGAPVYNAGNLQAASVAIAQQDRTRGVVWGAERPELLLTEGLAWHDRRAEDTAIVPEVDADGAGSGEPTDDGGRVVDGDDDLDQSRKPKGYLYLETFNPNDATQRPNEFYSLVQYDPRDPANAANGQVAFPGELVNGAPLQPGVQLGRVSNAEAVDPTDNSGIAKRSPVWRLACVEEHPAVRNASISPLLAESMGAALGVDLSDIDGLASELGIYNLPQASDDPPTPLNQQQGTSGRFEYLDVLLGGEPWTYSRPVFPGDVNQPALQVGNKATGVAPVLATAYSQLWLDKAVETFLGLAATEGNITTGVTDADGLNVAVGVIEQPITMADPTFPSFDQGAQPQAIARSEFRLSSRVEGRFLETETYNDKEYAVNAVDRTILLKPTRFLERVFYLTSPNSFDKTADNLSGVNNSGRIEALPDLNNPGYLIPDLFYAVPLYNANNLANGAITRKEVGVSQEGRDPSIPLGDPGNQAGDTDIYAKVRVSKFASLDLTSQNPDGSRNQIGQLDPLSIAPILPGRRAVLGTSGPIYDHTTTVAPSFTGTDAGNLSFRYTNLVSRLTNFEDAQTGNSDEARIDKQTGDPLRDSDDRLLRRFEMIPSSNANDHQFAVRLNGLNEATTLTLGGAAFNLSVGPESATPANHPISPVVAVPMDQFSISEPLDGYLIRQQELDPSLDIPFDYNISGIRDGDNPAEGSFRNGEGDRTAFDTPFDVLPELVENQTTPNYRALHLERLANPLLAWNPPPTRPNGTANLQHDPARPVNPYLPVDSQAVDLTAMNSYSMAEQDGVGSPAELNEFVHIPPGTGGGGTDDHGPAQRHRKARPLPGQSTSMETAIGFSSNERSRPHGPFDLLWKLRPSRLLWAQSQGATMSELLHADVAGSKYAAGQSYQARYLDRAFKEEGAEGVLGGTESATNDQYSFVYDETQFATRYRAHVVDFPWRMSLGFASWLYGEFHTGSGLEWVGDTGPPETINAEDIDIDGDGFTEELIGSVEQNYDGSEYEDLDGDGRPDNSNDLIINNNHELIDNHATPAFAWPNRPFVSAGELLQVPAWGGSRMLAYYSTFDWMHTIPPGWVHDTQVNPYNGEDGGFGFSHDGLDYSLGTLTNPSTFNGDFSDDGIAADTDNYREQAATNVLRFREMLGHFGHLLNFFETARFPSLTYQGNPGSAGTGVTPIPRGALHAYRLLDYVHTPSRFTATDQLLSADRFGAAGYSPDDARATYAAPFNRIDNYREPGRVNLNTIVGRGDSTEPADRWSEVYDGLMHRDKDFNKLVNSDLDNDYEEILKLGHLGPAWRDVELSRRGYVSPDINLSEDNGASLDYSPRRLHPEFPTFYANPFRAPGEGANVPLADMVQAGVSGTLLRPHPLSPGADSAWGQRGTDDAAIDRYDAANNVLGNDNINESDLVIDDYGEAGTSILELGGGDISLGSGDTRGDVPIQATASRINADAVLARFTDDGLRGALPDTFLEDALRPTPDDTSPRILPPGSSANNVEIAKRTTPVALFSGAALEPSIDTERNSTTRYQPIQRMANLATTRSNVYAVWITVGYFEVKPAAEDERIYTRYMTDNDGDNIGDAFNTSQLQTLFFQVYPDGYTLGEELGFDTGTNQRHRGFYIVDRSKPVGFRPGEDLNVSEAVLVRRRIE